MNEEELQAIEEIIVKCAKQGMCLASDDDGGETPQSFNDGFGDGVAFMRREILRALQLNISKKKILDK